MNPNPKVSIIIMNFNRWQDTLECLESVYQIEYPNYDVIVVDNASEDESLGKIREYSQGLTKVDSKLVKYKRKEKPLKLFEFHENNETNLLNPNHHSNPHESKIDNILKIEGCVTYTLDETNSKDNTNSNISKTSEDYLSEIMALPSNEKLIVLENRVNYGYTKGNNLAIDFALKNIDPDYILLLNEDTVVASDFLDNLVDVAEQNNEVGCVGPKVYYYDYKGRKDVISFAGEKINLYTSLGNRFCKNKVDKNICDKIIETDKIEGCSILFKKEALLKVGLFDHIYWAYWEETDLCFRIRNQGYKVLYAPKARIWHKIGLTWDNYYSYYIIYHYLVRNRLIFIWRYASLLQKIVFFILFPFYLTIHMVIMIITKDKDTSKNGFRAVKDGFRDFKALRNKRLIYYL